VQCSVFPGNPREFMDKCILARSKAHIFCKLARISVFFSWLGLPLCILPSAKKLSASRFPPRSHTQKTDEKVRIFVKPE
jgi:hypothetical protein